MLAAVASKGKSWLVAYNQAYQTKTGLISEGSP